MIWKFESETCIPCKKVSAYLDSVGARYKRIDVSEDVENVFKYNIMSVPTVLLLDSEGNVLDQSIGYKPSELDELIRKEANL